MGNRVEMAVEEIAAKLLEGSDIELVAVEYVKEKNWYLSFIQFWSDTM